MALKRAWDALCDVVNPELAKGPPGTRLLKKTLVGDDGYITKVNPAKWPKAISQGVMRKGVYAVSVCRHTGASHIVPFDTVCFAVRKAHPESPFEVKLDVLAVTRVGTSDMYYRGGFRKVGSFTDWVVDMFESVVADRREYRAHLALTKEGGCCEKRPAFLGRASPFPSVSLTDRDGIWLCVHRIRRAGISTALYHVWRTADKNKCLEASDEIDSDSSEDSSEEGK